MNFEAAIAGSSISVQGFPAQVVQLFSWLLVPWSCVWVCKEGKDLRAGQYQSLVVPLKLIRHLTCSLLVFEGLSSHRNRRVLIFIC
jgi:hypothetical protein